MFKRVFIGLATMICLISSPVFSINYKRLDQEAQGCFSNIWSGPSLSKQNIKNKLIFMNERDEKVNKYSDSKKFEKFYESLEPSICNKKLSGFEVRNKRFLDFAKICGEIFNEESDVMKASVHKLLKQVFNKYVESLKTAEIFRERHVELPEVDPDPDATKALREIFTTADKSCVIPDELKKRLKDVKL